MSPEGGNHGAQQRRRQIQTTRSTGKAGDIRAKLHELRALVLATGTPRLPQIQNNETNRFKNSFRLGSKKQNPGQEPRRCKWGQNETIHEPSAGRRCRSESPTSARRHLAPGFSTLPNG